MLPKSNYNANACSKCVKYSIKRKRECVLWHWFTEILEVINT